MWKRHLGNLEMFEFFYAVKKFERKKNLELNHRLDKQDGVIEAMRIAFLFKKGGRKKLCPEAG